MNIFVINLEQDKEKKNQMKQILNQYSNNYHFFTAINGREISSKYQEVNINLDWYDPFYHTHISQGEVGCALSHFSLWKRIIDDKIEKAIILEDDIIIKDSNWLSIIDNIDCNYDFIYLGRKKMTPDSLIESTLIEISPQLVRPSFSYWTCGYIITLSGAKKLYQPDLFKKFIVIDEYLPYMICQGDHFNQQAQQILDQSYKYLKDQVSIQAYAFNPPLVTPNNQAFNISNTFHSSPFLQFKTDIICVSIATDKNDCYYRYIGSCQRYSIKPIVLGLDTDWRGGNMMEGPGGGHKVNLLKEFLKTLNINTLIVFTDCYDVMMNDNINILQQKYQEYYYPNIVFASEASCWPDTSLESKYPSDTKNILTRYLNSGLFIGYSDDIKKILKPEIENNYDDQLYYTHLFLSNSNIKLDYKNYLFLCLNSLTNKIHIEKDNNFVHYNDTRPVFIHGNGPESIKIFFNNIITNYCYEYNSTYGAKKNVLDYKTSSSKIIMVLNQNEFNDDYQLWLSSIDNLDYYKKNIHIFLVYKDSKILSIFDQLFTKEKYLEITIIYNKDNQFWLSLFDMSSFKQLQTKDENQENTFQYIFYCKNSAIIENPQTLKSLINQKKGIIAPLLKRKSSPFSNFWGDLDYNGFYKRSINYHTILNKEDQGCWSVPYISECLLINKSYCQLSNFINDPINYNDLDLIFCYNVRRNFNFMYVINNQNWGYLLEESLLPINQTKDLINQNLSSSEINIVDLESINLHSIFDQKNLWEQKYLNSRFLKNLDYYEDLNDDVNKIYLFNDHFCQEVIKLTESGNKWSQGGNSYYDNRINNIENFPTQDIQLYELKLEKVWEKIVEYYIAPFMSNKYKYKTKDINISFVVKYSLNGQKELDPHHDSSTYTVNLSLNKDFEEGGCHFVKQNKTVINKDIGSIIIHPGKITHYHQGLSISSGTRYILVSFIN